MVQHELAWFVEHVQQSPGLFFFKFVVWQEDSVGHSMLTIHIDASTWGLGIWFLLEKRGYQCLLPIQHPTDAIFHLQCALQSIYLNTSQEWHTYWLPQITPMCLMSLLHQSHNQHITLSSSQWSTFSSDVTLTWELFTFQDHSITSLTHYCDTKMISPGNSFLPFRSNYTLLGCAGGFKKMVLISASSRQPPRVS